MLNVNILDEDGNQIRFSAKPPDDYLDEEGTLSNIIFNLPKGEYKIIHHIDLWGDTLLNRFQSRLLVEDIKLLLSMMDDEKKINVLKTVMHLSGLCHSDVHQYLKFIGD